tara:strand:- start:1504 stop:1677 length:174 start_codon:yes stop_codon:yes gene_type:complete
MLTPKCDRCGKNIDPENDAAICFHHDDGDAYLCEECIEIVKEEFYNEIRTTNTSESD